jgi:hypothetical protein
MLSSGMREQLRSKGAVEEVEEVVEEELGDRIHHSRPSPRPCLRRRMEEGSTERAKEGAASM